MHQVTEILCNEEGEETHESWLAIRANRVSGSSFLFDSEIMHQSFIRVTISRMERKRHLNHDFKYERDRLVELDMSEAQWGAFVSSFGQGTGVPATLSYLVGQGRVSSAPHESRLDESHKEVRSAGAKAMAKVQGAHAEVQEAFERGAGKKEMRQLLRNLEIMMQHVPANMEFAAKSLTEHAENVVTKAKSDIEAMALSAQTGQENVLTVGQGGTLDVLELGSGEVE